MDFRKWDVYFSIFDQMINYKIINIKYIDNGNNPQLQPYLYEL